MLDQEILVFACIVYNIGQTFVRRCRFDVAKSWFGRAMKRVVSASLQDLEEKQHSRRHHHLLHGDFALMQVRILHNLGYCMYRLGKKTEASTMYWKALSLARSENLDPHHVATSKNAAAVLLYHRQEEETSRSEALYNHAMCLFQESFAALVAEYGLESRQVATVLNNMGRLHFENAEFVQALDAYEKALRIRRHSLDSDSVDITATVCNVGQAWHRVGDLRYEEGRVQEASTMYKKSLEVFLFANDYSQREQSILLNKLGTVSFELNFFVEALDYFTTGLNIALTVLEANHPHVLITLLNIAQIHLKLGDFSSAILKYYQVHALLVTAHGLNSLQAAALLSIIGQLRYLQQDFDSALALFQEVLQIQCRHGGDEGSLDVAGTLTSIGLILFNNGHPEQSRVCFAESLRIRQRCLGVDHLDTALHVCNLATAYWESGDEDRAIRLYQETLRIEKRSGNHGDVILTLQYLGIIHQNRGELERALECFAEALELEREYGSKTNGTVVAKLANLIGNLHLQTGNVRAMMECYVEASKMYNELGLADDTLVIAGFYFYFFNKLHPPTAAVA